MPHPVTAAEALEDYFKAHPGDRPAQLAKRAGVSPSHIWDVQHGFRRFFSRAEAPRLAAASVGGALTVETLLGVHGGQPDKVATSKRRRKVNKRARKAV
jgi:hypothetical protein